MKAVFALLCLAMSGAPAMAEVTVGVVGSEFRLTGEDGTVLAQAALPGRVFAIEGGKGGRRTIRIDAVARDARDPEIALYEISTRDTENGTWRNFCRPAPDGRTQAFPLAGAWTEDARHVPAEGRYVVTCTSGAIGKCVRAGYKPWQPVATGPSMWDRHQACVRMFRADYCGDGRSTTRDGMLIAYARVDERLAARPDMLFEAAWGPDGAACIARVRVPENTSLARLIEQCPAKLAGRTGDSCSELEARSVSGALLINRSRPVDPD